MFLSQRRCIIGTRRDIIFLESELIEKWVIPHLGLGNSQSDKNLVENSNFLTFQIKQMSFQPDMILDNFLSKVFVDYVTLNEGIDIL